MPEIPVSVTPAKSIYSIGEPIKIEFIVPDTLTDNLSGKKIYIPDLDLRTWISIVKLVDPAKRFPDQQLAVPQFEYVNSVGKFINPRNRGIDVNYVYEQGRYKFSGLIIPKEKGVYALQFIYSPPREEGVGIPTAQMGTTADGTKIMATMQFIYYMINEGETNYETLFIRNCQPAYEIDGSLGPLEKLLVYTFEVK